VTTGCKRSHCATHSIFASLFFERLFGGQGVLFPKGSLAAAFLSNPPLSAAFAFAKSGTSFWRKSLFSDFYKDFI
jgi:hypothetical protein